MRLSISPSPWLVDLMQRTQAAYRRYAARHKLPEELGYKLAAHYRKGMEEADGRERLTPVRKARVLRGGKF